jgi:hypothetical protein
LVHRTIIGADPGATRANDHFQVSIYDYRWIAMAQNNLVRCNIFIIDSGFTPSILLVDHNLKPRSATMDQKQIFKQMMNFNKGAFNNAYNAMIMVQDQTETLANSMLNQATWLPEEGKKALNDWVDAFKKGREAYKKTVDDAFAKVEEFL